MKRFRYAVLMLLVAGAMLLPAGMQASAQGGDLCEDAREQGGSEYAGYEVVYLTGGSGSQIVLGPDEGGAYLSGGSGNDVLCAWGNNNTLDGGSGNDLLMAPNGPRNTFLGGSGNDTMIGVVGDDFDGGSGRNEIIAAEPAPELNPVLTILFQYDPDAENLACKAGVELTGFAPRTEYQVTLIYNGHRAGPDVSVTTDVNGNGTTGYAYISPAHREVQASIAGMEEVTTGMVETRC